MRTVPRLLVGLATFILPACGSREKVEYYPTGEVKYREPLEGQGQVNGKYFYKNGTVSAVLPLRNGRVEGLVKRYYPSGQLESTERYKNGERFGLVKLYYPTGQLKHQATGYGMVYADTSRSFHPNGELSQMIIYDHKGRRIDFGVWHPNGHVDTSYTRPFFLSDRDTIAGGQDYAFEVVLGNRRSNVVQVKVLRPMAGLDSVKGVYSHTRFLLRRPAPGRHTLTVMAINRWARKGSDTIWVDWYKPISKSFWVLSAQGKK